MEKQQKKIDKMKNKLEVFEKKLGETKKNILKKKLETIIAQGNKKIMEEEEILKKLEVESIEEETSDLNKINEDAEKENKEIELIKNQKTEPVIGAIPSVQREIDKLRNSESLLRLQNVTLQDNVGKLELANSSYSDSISSIKKNMNAMSEGVEKGLTKTVQCERCVTGNTLLGELEDKVVFVLTRRQYAKDEYNKSKLSMNGENGCINIEVKDYNTETDDKLYNVLYSTDKNDTTLPVSVFKMSVVPNTTRNSTNMIINNIKRRNVQVLQVSNLENKPEYTNMFKHFESAFIPMTDALKYIQEIL
jgi:putative lipoic acid-binding regulatory protein